MKKRNKAYRLLTGRLGERRFGGFQSGETFLIDRLQLIEQLERVSRAARKFHSRAIARPGLSANSRKPAALLAGAMSVSTSPPTCETGC